MDIQLHICKQEPDNLRSGVKNDIEYNDSDEVTNVKSVSFISL